jgi:hypothetical protein
MNSCATKHATSGSPANTDHSVFLAVATASGAGRTGRGTCIAGLGIEINCTLYQVDPGLNGAPPIAGGAILKLIQLIANAIIFHGEDHFIFVAGK